MRSVLYNRRAIQPFLDAARDRRCDIAIVGDSNTGVNSSGHQWGMQAAFAGLFGLYATPVCASNPQNSFASASYSSGPGTYGTTPPNGGTSAPSNLDQYRLAQDGNSYPYGYLWLPSGSSGYLAQNFASGPPAFDSALHQKWWFDYGTFSTGTGSINPGCRIASSVTVLAHTTSLTTNTGTDTGNTGLALASLDVPAGSAAAGNTLWWEFALHPAAGGTNAVGPFFSNWQRVELPDVSRGVAYSVMLYQGGLGTRSAALSLQATTQVAFNEWANFLTMLQNTASNADRMLLVHVMQGQNDDVDTNPSVGPNPAASNTPAGIYDNTWAVISRLRTLWTGAGYAAKNLFFLIGPYHPQSSHYSWRQQSDPYLRKLADATYNVAVADSTRRISTFESYLANSWYDSPPTDYHLANAASFVAADGLAINTLFPTASVKFKGTTGQTLYCVLWPQMGGGYVWDNTNLACTPYVNANWTSYAIALTENGTSGTYEAKLPYTLKPGAYLPEVRVKVGASYAVTDASATGTLLTPLVEWDGGTSDGNRAVIEKADEVSRQVASVPTASPTGS